MIDPNEVDAIFKDCLFLEAELDGNGKPKIEPVTAEGITGKFGFHPDRLKSYSTKLTEFLKELPDGFHKKLGGGWSFLNACETKNGEQWTGLHQRMEQLFVMGIALGKVKYSLPKEMWSILPGGMPYLVVDVE